MRTLIMYESLSVVLQAVLVSKDCCHAMLTLSCGLWKREGVKSEKQWSSSCRRQ